MLQTQPRTPKIDKPAELFSMSEKNPELSKNSRNDGGKLKADKESFDIRLVDPDEVVDPALLDNQSLTEDEDDYESKSEASSDSSLVPYDLSDDGVASTLDVAERLIRASPDELQHASAELARALVHICCSDLKIEGEVESAGEMRQKALIALHVFCPFESAASLSKLLHSPHIDVSQWILILDVMTDAALELAAAKDSRIQNNRGSFISYASGSQPWFLPSAEGPVGVGPWKEVSESGTLLSYTHRFERELPTRWGQIKKGKSRRWRTGPDKVQEYNADLCRNKFLLYGAAFMQGFDRKTHGVDFVGRDFIVLGKLIYMLGVCMKCMTMHTEASALAPALLDMLSSRSICPEVCPFCCIMYIGCSSPFICCLCFGGGQPGYVKRARLDTYMGIACCRIRSRQ